MPNKYYKIGYTTTKEESCTVIVEAPSNYVARTWFAECSSKSISTILYCRKFEDDLSKYTLLKAKAEETTKLWHIADISTTYIRDKIEAFLKENNIVYIFCEYYNSLHFEYLINKDEEIMLDKFFEELGVSIYD